MANINWERLQLFAQGASSGETAADAGQQTAGDSEIRANGQDAAAREPEAARRMTWEEVKADPQFNREIQAIVRERLKAARAGSAPAPDPAALEEHFRQHIRGLERQGESMKEAFPGFDLRRELQNPAFARMTAPDVGISVEDAYYALHRGEIQSAAMQVTAQKTAQMISDSIRSGKLRPLENGAASQGATVTAFDYRGASREQREALKRRIREAGARGEKLYPGR